MVDVMMDLFGILVYVNVNVIICDVGEYLDYENCKCRKRLIDKLIEECSENINENQMVYNVTSNGHGRVCESCTIYIVLLIKTFIIIIGIDSIYFYFLINCLANV